MDDQHYITHASNIIAAAWHERQEYGAMRPGTRRLFRRLSDFQQQTKGHNHASLAAVATRLHVERLT